MSDKPREFWVTQSTQRPFRWKCFVGPYGEECRDMIHVIEKSAHDLLMKDVSGLLKLLKLAHRNGTLYDDFEGALAEWNAKYGDTKPLFYPEPGAQAQPNLNDNPESEEEAY